MAPNLCFARPTYPDRSGKNATQGPTRSVRARGCRENFLPTPIQLSPGRRRQGTDRPSPRCNGRVTDATVADHACPPARALTHPPLSRSIANRAEQESRSALSARPERPLGVQTSPENDSRLTESSRNPPASFRLGFSGRRSKQQQGVLGRVPGCAQDACADRSTGLGDVMLGIFRRRPPASTEHDSNPAPRGPAPQGPMLLCMTTGASAIAMLAQTHAACVSSDDEAEPAEQAATAAADKKGSRQALERRGAWATLHLHAQLR